MLNSDSDGNLFEMTAAVEAVQSNAAALKNWLPTADESKVGRTAAGKKQQRMPQAQRPGVRHKCARSCKCMVPISRMGLWSAETVSDELAVLALHSHAR